MRVTQHRYHAANNLEPFVRIDENNKDIFFNYRYTDCPGFDNPVNQFPVVDTLLSIPFSLLHTLPRLVSLLPPTRHQQELIQMAYEIIMLWWWEPSSDQQARVISASLQNTRRAIPPKPIHLRRETFTTTTTTFGTAAAQSSGSTPHHVPHSFELPSGQILIGIMPSVSLDTEGLLRTSGGQVSGEPKGITHPTKCIVSSSALTIASDTWDVQTGGDNSDVVDERTEASAVEAKSEIDSLLVDVKSWSEKVVDCVPTPLPLTPSPFERGIRPWELLYVFSFFLVITDSVP
jgi:hypothetical protein